MIRPLARPQIDLQATKNISKSHIDTFDFLVVDELLHVLYVTNSLGVNLQTVHTPYVRLMKFVESVAQSRRLRGTLKFVLRVNSIWVNVVVARLIFGVVVPETTHYFPRKIVERRKEEVLH